MLLHEIIEMAAADRPADTALVVDGRRISFGQLDHRVRALTGMVAACTTRGARVLIVSDNHLDVVTAMYAVPAAGAVLAFGNTRHTAAELTELASTIEATVLFATPNQLDRIAAPLRQALPALRVMSIAGGHDQAEIDLTGHLDLAVAEGQTNDREVTEPPALDECAWLIHTSGTTGRAKGVQLSHRSLAAGVTNSAIARPMADDDVYLFPFPLFHVAAYNVLHAHLRRRPVVLVARFDAAEVLDLVEREGVTTCSLAPTMLAMLLDHPDHDPDRLRGLRQISYGASSMPLDLLRRVLAELPDCGLAQGYGMTELSGNAVFLSPDAHRRAATDSPHLLAAAGRPGPLVAVRIVDDHDVEVPVGATGEILVRGDQVCEGYWNDPDSGTAARVGPWFRTGDIGRFDAEGYLYVVDRLKDIIITGGENVASREVEDVLSVHPDIGAVAVVGVPDERWGETVCAVVVPAPSGNEFDATAIIEWTDGRLAGFKRPRRLLQVEALPLNASGKVDKRAVRDLVARSLDS